MTVELYADKLIIGIDKDGLLLVFKSREEVASRVAFDPSWDIKEVDFYTDQGQHLIPEEGGSGAYRLVPHGRPDKENLQALFARARDIVLSGVPTIKDISDLKKALLWEDTI